MQCGTLCCARCHTPSCPLHHHCAQAWVTPVTMQPEEQLRLRLSHSMLFENSTGGDDIVLSRFLYGCPAAGSVTAHPSGVGGSYTVAMASPLTLTTGALADASMLPLDVDWVRARGGADRGHACADAAWRAGGGWLRPAGLRTRARWRLSAPAPTVVAPLR